MSIISLGDLRAEVDKVMLNFAYYETVDYKSILENSTKSVVVGRRGTGKSAMFFRLSNDFDLRPRSTVIRLAPDEHEIIGLRHFIQFFGEDYRNAKAGARLAFKLLILLEILARISQHFKFSRLDSHPELLKVVNGFCRLSKNPFLRVQRILQNSKLAELPEALRVAEFADQLGLKEIELGIKEFFAVANHKVFVLVDKLDEGNVDDELGVSLASGFAYAITDYNVKFQSSFRGVVFLRDNVYRSISIHDAQLSATALRHICGEYSPPARSGVRLSYGRTVRDQGA